MSDLNGYQLSRQWFDFSFKNPEKIKPAHSAIYFFAIEHCNRLGWKEKFGFPTQMVMEAIGIKNWRTYNAAFTDLVDWGFIDLIEKSKNQYSSCIICLCKKYNGTVESHTKSLDKALQKHSQKQRNSTVVINKQYNNITKEQGNKEQCARVRGCPIPEKLQVEHFQERYKGYWDYMNHTHKKQASIQVVESQFRRLLELKEKGHDPVKVIDQTISAGNKSFYPLKDNQFNKSKDNEQPIEKSERHLRQTERIFKEDNIKASSN